MSVEDFLKQRAVDVTVGGSYSLHRWYDCEGKLRTFACRTKRVSPFRMIVDVPVVGFSEIFRLPMLPPANGGQSKLVLPNCALVPCTVHG